MCHMSRFYDRQKSEVTCAAWISTSNREIQVNRQSFQAWHFTLVVQAYLYFYEYELLPSHFQARYRMW